MALPGLCAARRVNPWVLSATQFGTLVIVPGNECPEDHAENEFLQGLPNPRRHGQTLPICALKLEKAPLIVDNRRYLQQHLRRRQAWVNSALGALSAMHQGSPRRGIPRLSAGQSSLSVAQHSVWQSGRPNLSPRDIYKLDPSVLIRCGYDKLTILATGVRPQVCADFQENPMRRVPRDDSDLAKD